MSFGKLRSLYQRQQIGGGTMVWMSGQEHQGASVDSYPGLIVALSAPAAERARASRAVPVPGPGGGGGRRALR